MENDDTQPLLDEYHRQLDEQVKQVGSTADRILSYAQLRISANERLIFLASGVLTLTFSGAISFYGRTNVHLSAGAAWPLLWAWKLLILAIICCIIANSREGLAASIHDTDLLAYELWARETVITTIRNKLNPDLSAGLKMTPQLSKTGALQEKIAGLCG